MFRLVATGPAIAVAAAGGYGLLLWLALGGAGLFWFLGTAPLVLLVVAIGAWMALPVRNPR